jgi:hypothetical protein
MVGLRHGLVGVESCMVVWCDGVVGVKWCPIGCQCQRVLQRKQGDVHPPLKVGWVGGVEWCLVWWWDGWMGVRMVYGWGLGQVGEVGVVYGWVGRGWSGVRLGGGMGWWDRLVGMEWCTVGWRYGLVGVAWCIIRWRDGLVGVERCMIGQWDD